MVTLTPKGSASHGIETFGFAILTEEAFRKELAIALFSTETGMGWPRTRMQAVLSEKTGSKPDLVPVTQRLIENGKSGAGGWTRAQLEIIGVKWPPKHGWRRRVDGALIPRSEADRFVSLKGCTKQRSKPIVDLLLNFDATG